MKHRMRRSRGFVGRLQYFGAQHKRAFGQLGRQLHWVPLHVRHEAEQHAHADAEHEGEEGEGELGVGCLVRDRGEVE